MLPLQANREAPTLQFTSNEAEIERTTTTAALVNKFEPENEMEAEVAALLQKAGAATASALQEAEDALALKARGFCCFRCQSQCAIVS